MSPLSSTRILCFHKCEGHLFYKTFLLGTIPNSTDIRDQWDLSEAGLQRRRLALGEIIKLGIANSVCK